MLSDNRWAYPALVAVAAVLAMMAFTAIFDTQLLAYLIIAVVAVVIGRAADPRRRREHRQSRT